MRTEIESAMSSDTAIGFNARIAAIPSGTDATARTTVIASHPCRQIMQLDNAQRERAGMATIVKALRCECAYSALVKPRQRLIYDGVDYRIHSIVLRPASASPLYLVLYLEDEGVTA